ncbi:MAG: monofunctional biosynthetic peptidoglycan transglycosylase [Proteobacteria bacterium]|nr:MAG: monofunctional biosynthetic peptidoglycan transglycosylase [Pseudomonadota bacterium]
MQKTKLKTFLIWTAKVAAGLFTASVLIVIVYRFVPVPYTPLMLIRSLQAGSDRQLGANEKKWVSFDQMAPSIARSVVKAEDAKFYDHYGFDVEAIRKAYKYNQTHRQKKGASTISQQTAKNVFLWPSRDWIRKGLETYFTVLIELVWPKQRILEVYLNVIELGPGVYGVEAASQRYFKHTAKKITNAEAALIAAVLPNPRKFRIDRPSAYVLRRQSRILNRVAPPPQKIEEPAPLDDQDDSDLQFDDEDFSNF